MSGRIEAIGVGKRFNRYRSDRARTLKQSMLSGWRRSKPVASFWALRDVSFTVAGGSMLAVIGHNGSGKSTLLRLIGGVLKPDSGTIALQGQVGGLLELNSGMHNDLTGRENLLIGAVVAGLSRREALAKLDEIVAFAELEDFIDAPLRTYSAGMKLRLGFAVAVHGRPGVLLIDEVLAVGDLAFQNKCIERIRRFRDDGSAIVLATHDLHQVVEVCDRALWLRHGEAMAHGDPAEVANEYRTRSTLQAPGPGAAAIGERRTASGVLLQPNVNRFGNFAMAIEEVRLLDAAGNSTMAIDPGDGIIVEVDYRAEAPHGPPVLEIAIDGRSHEQVVKMHSAGDGVQLPVAGDNRISIAIGRLDLAPGTYHVNVGLYDADWSQTYDYHWHAYPLRVNGSASEGLVNPPRRWSSSR